MKFSWLLLLVLTVGVLTGTEPVWRRALGGEISGFAAQGPGGDVYIVADDRALHSLNPETGESNWLYRPGGHLKNFIMTAADGTVYVQNDRLELFAVTPGGTGRWKLNMGIEAAVLPAASPDGRIVLPLQGGRIVCLSRRGVILWTLDESAEASASPVADTDGSVWIPLTDGRLIVLDSLGQQIREVRTPDMVSILAMDASGRIWAGGFSGYAAIFPPPDSGSEAVESRPGSSRVAAILTAEDSSGQIFFADGAAVSWDSEGNETARGQLNLSGGSPSASADGMIYAPSADGRIQVVPPDAPVSYLQARSVLAEPLLTDQGMLIAGDSEWILYGWEAAVPGAGWRQFRGSSRRSGTFPAEPYIPDRQTARKDPAFFFREQMAVSDNAEERMALLDEMESYANDASLRQDMPWADLLFEDLSAQGTIRRSLISYPEVRARAYQLMGEGEDFRLRGLLLECLRHEYDSIAMAAGFRALGNIGSDWDGASLRMIAEQFRELSPAGESFALETARALRDLVRYNGEISDPSGYALINELISLPLTRAARNEIMVLVRDISGL